MPVESTFPPKPCIMFIGMNTWRSTARRLDEQIDNAGVPPHGNQDPPLEEVANDDKALVNHPPLIDGDIKAAYLQMAHAFTTQA